MGAAVPAAQASTTAGRSRSPSVRARATAVPRSTGAADAPADRARFVATRRADKAVARHAAHRAGTGAPSSVNRSAAARSGSAARLPSPSTNVTTAAPHGSHGSTAGAVPGVSSASSARPIRDSHGQPPTSASSMSASRSVAGSSTSFPASRPTTRPAQAAGATTPMSASG